MDGSLNNCLNIIYMTETKKLIIDIETIGEDFDGLDEVTQNTLTRWIKKESSSEEAYQKSLDDLKNGMGFSPLTGQIVAIGVLCPEKNEGAVYYQAPGEKSETQSEEFEENKIKLEAMDEKMMLEKFWDLARGHQEFITFNGRTFDVPFVMIRSAIHGVLPTKNLMSNRYLNLQKYGAKHIDLLDQLTFYGASMRKGSLHLWSRAFGIKSPKADGVNGDDVSRLFQEKKFLDIARYNVGDLLATRKLYEYWEKYLKF